MNRGSCLCNDIAWQFDGAFSFVSNCHCSMCRKAHGTTFATWAAAPAQSFAWVRGEDRIADYASAPGGHRYFCPRCGSAVAMVEGDLALTPVGNLDRAVDRPLDSHIFVASKACWHDISDEAKQYDGYPPEYGRPGIDQPHRPAATDGSVPGSCLCGDVRYEFDPPATRMVNCHCTRCRKARSAVHSTQVFVPLDQFRWLAGESSITTYKLPGAKYFAPSFCNRCGGKVPGLSPPRGAAVVPAGSLDGDPGIRPQAHVFVGSRSPSHSITDDLPQFEEYPPQ